MMLWELIAIDTTVVTDPSLFSALLTALAEPRPLADEVLAGSAQLEWLAGSGLGPLLCHVAGPHCSATAYPQLHSHMLSARFAAADQCEAMVEILNAAQGLARPPALLKGISVSHQYYPAPYLRLMRDIDLLVADDDMTALEQVLRTLGYRQQAHRPVSYFEQHHHSMPFFHPGKNVWIEVHKRLFRPDSVRSGITAFSVDSMNAELRASKFQDFDVLRLSPEYQLIYIAAHWSQRFQPAGGLIAFVDLLYLLKAQGDALDWEKIEHWADAPLMAAWLSTMLSYLQNEVPGVIDTRRLQAVSAKNTLLSSAGRRVCHRMIDRYYVSGAAYGPLLTGHNLAVIWDTLFRGGSMPFVARALWNVVFPPKDPQRYSLRRQWRRLRSSVGRFR